MKIFCLKFNGVKEFVVCWGEIKTIKYLLIVLGSFDDLGQK